MFLLISSVQLLLVPLLYLDVLVPGADGFEQILDLLLVLPGLMGAVSQHFLEEAVLKLETDLQLLQDVTGSRVDLSEQGGAQILQPGERFIYLCNQTRPRIRRETLNPLPAPPVSEHAAPPAAGR